MRRTSDYRGGRMKPNTIVQLSALALILSLLFVPAQAAQNVSVPTNTTQAQAANPTAQEQFTAEKAIETLLLIGIIVSPVSFLLSVVALWVALKNRRKVYEIQ